MKPKLHRKSSRAGRIFAERFATAFTGWAGRIFAERFATAFTGWAGRIFAERFATAFTGWSNLRGRIRYCIHGLVESSRKDSLLQSRAGPILAVRLGTAINAMATLYEKVLDPQSRARPNVTYSVRAQRREKGH